MFEFEYFHNSCFYFTLNLQFNYLLSNSSNLSLYIKIIKNTYLCIVVLLFDNYLHCLSRLHAHDVYSALWFVETLAAEVVVFSLGIVEGINSVDASSRAVDAHAEFGRSIGRSAVEPSAERTNLDAINRSRAFQFLHIPETVL